MHANSSSTADKSSHFPSRREGAVILACLVLWLAVTAAFVGFRPEHLYLAIFLGGMLFVAATTRKLVVALLPFIVFGISYDWMNILPNYEVNPVDIVGLYEAEKGLFGISVEGLTLTPNEWWALHQSTILDFMAGCFYLCWVPVPIMFGLWLYFDRQYSIYLQFAIAFLLVNLLGFALYYVHPAAPPWYVDSYGFTFIPGTHGETAGLGRWDTMTGLGIFDVLYSRNSNVFAAFPSLHAAYMLVAFIYSLQARCSWWLKALFAFICLGIWFTAVYTSHHYIIDIIAGICVSLIGCAIVTALSRLKPAQRFLNAYTRYISRG
ncbi:MAG: phosphatase PAP2 family protein [Muribaculaceae bacterium]|nr:phosphatase PAP2 family protein [Muribaculaceae bacterium]